MEPPAETPGRPVTDAVLERVVEQASELLRAQRVGLAVIEPDVDVNAGPILRFVAARGLSAQFPHVMRPRHWRDGTTPIAISERRPVWSEDVLNDPAIDLTPATRRSIEGEGYRAVLSVPLLLGDRALGALVLYRDEPGPFTPEVIELAQVFAAQAAVAIENARLYRRAEDRAGKLRALSALTQLIVTAATSGEVSQAVAEASTQLLGASVTRVWVDVPELGVLRVEATSAVDASHLGAYKSDMEMQYHEGIAGAVFRDRQPLYGPDIQADPRRSDRLLAFDPGLHAYAALPLVTAKRVVGVLVLLFAERRHFTAEEQELMRLLADQAAIAIRQSQLYREAERRRQEAEVMAELASKISASLELDDVLARVAEGARALCHSDGSCIAVRTPDDPVVRFRHWVGNRYDSWNEVVLEPGKGFGGHILATGESYRTDDFAADPRFTADYMDAISAEGIVASLAVPIVSRDEIHGVLYVNNRSRRPFTDRDEAILRRLADYAAAAIANANLYQGLRTAHEQLARSQSQLVQNERLRALGEMAAGVAHDFNNMLAVILGRADLLLRRSGDPTMRRELEDVRRAAANGAATVRRIQNFTGTRRARPPGRVALGDVVREVVQLTRVRWKDEAQRNGVQYEVSVEGDAPIVAAHADELREVFTNLLNNALDAMPTGGRCTFRLATGSQMATVDVEDTGIGMPPEVCARIFEPFFTTKGPKNSGLGLAVTWGIVTSCGGAIAVSSTPGRGTRLTVSLPIPVTLPDEAPGDIGSAATGAARVLVVDDDETVRDVLTDMLMEAGHVVKQAESGAAALDLCAGEPFDLVITDLSMPGMSGWDVAAALHSTRPGLAIGIVTGWGEQVDPDQAARHHLKFVLAKPFLMGDVTSAVSGALDGRAARG
ncbi:MAG TPA: GAF domain-containing protein [Methylomirabilota bacterium]|nr:GAF domain-containing protein [Methylomirabilota bacterium]